MGRKKKKFPEQALTFWTTGKIFKEEDFWTFDAILGTSHEEKKTNLTYKERTAHNAHNVEMNFAVFFGLNKIQSDMPAPVWKTLATIYT